MCAIQGVEWTENNSLYTTQICFLSSFMHTLHMEQQFEIGITNVQCLGVISNGVGNHSMCFGTLLHKRKTRTWNKYLNNKLYTSDMYVL